jgi:integrase
MARRSANGEGSIYRRKDGRWEGAAYVSTISNARKRMRVYGTTRAEAHSKLTALVAKDQQGIPTPDKAWKLGEYLDYWLEEVVRPNLRSSTYETYEQRIRLNLRPTLGRYALTRLTVATVQDFFNQQLADGHSVRKVQMMREVLRSALSHAMHEEHVARNVARLVKLPKYEPEEIYPWSVDEARRFLVAAQSDPLAAAFTLLVVYGLREGEVLGLRWQDVNPVAGILEVRQQLQRTGGALRQTPLKTRAGRRDLPLIGLTRTALTRQQVRQASARQAVGMNWQGGGDAAELVFTTKSGLPIEPRNFVRSFQRICEQHEVRRIKVHHVRHTAATTLKSLGVAARDAQLILGHSQISTTQQIYQHDSMEGRQQALDLVERALGSDTKDDQDKGPDRLGLMTAVVDGNDCRQTLPSSLDFMCQIMSSTSGAASRTRTEDLLFTKSIDTTLCARLNRVSTLTDRCRRQWILGTVAVNLAVKITAHTNA